MEINRDDLKIKTVDNLLYYLKDDYKNAFLELEDEQGNKLKIEEIYYKTLAGVKILKIKLK